MRAIDVSPISANLSKTSRLGDLLVAGGLITAEQLEEGLKYQRAKGGRLGGCLIKLGHISEDVLHSVLTRQFDVPMVDLSSCDIEPDIVKLLPRDCAARCQAMPVKRTGNLLSVALNDPNDFVALDELRFRTG